MPRESWLWTGIFTPPLALRALSRRPTFSTCIHGDSSGGIVRLRLLFIGCCNHFNNQVESTLAMGKTRREPSRDESFNKHYAAIWGEERWRTSLYPALVRPTRHSALVNQALPPAAFPESIGDAGIDVQDLEQIPWPTWGEGPADGSGGRWCLARRLSQSSEGRSLEALLLPQPQRSARSDTSASLMSHWNMDAASVLAARLLDVKPGDAVLDLCAAPGGKSIALAQSLFFSATGQLPENAENSTLQSDKTLLSSNEADRSRFRRLAENLRIYLPDSANVRCTNVDATSPNAHRELAIAEGWDKILVDAPCSSERHLIHASVKAQTSGRVAPEMASWRPGSTKRLQETQARLLMAALRLVKTHGTILYATCSIEPGENDGVVEKVMVQVEKERKKGLITWSFQLTGFSTCLGSAESGADDFLGQHWAERTKHGWIVLPDHPSGGRWGPLFFTRLIKVPD